jgi:iron-sulfur cluster assembly protein
MAQQVTSLIGVTDAAVEKLKAILLEEDAADAALRVMVVPNGQGVEYMLTLETDPKEDDLISEFSGVKVVIDEDSAPLMEGAEIDYVEDLMRSGFVISNPNFSVGGGCGSGECGCGGNCACGAGH